jgi:hypothetical protein
VFSALGITVASLSPTCKAPIWSERSGDTIVLPVRCAIPPPFSRALAAIDPLSYGVDGVRIDLFDDCSAFTRVTACTLALSPYIVTRIPKASAISSPP